MSRKHPSALPFLFLTEMWERFGYYLMIGIFQLYLMDPVSSGGMAMERKDAADIYGTFIAFVFLTPFLGGLLADRILGYTRSIFLGGTLMGLGYIGLALPGMAAFYTSLALICIGNGFFKPNISTLLGNLYNDDRYRARKDSGYNIFYMGINVGACICNLFAAYMRNKYGWGYAFATAGIGMFLSLVIFYIGLKHYRHADVRKPVQKEDMPLARIFSIVLLPAILVGIAGWAIPGSLLGSDSTDAFIFATIPVIIFFVSLYMRASAEDRKPLVALLSIFAVAIAFWAVFKQNGTALTTWAQYYTDRELPAAIVPAADALYLVEKPVNAIDTVVAYDDEFKVVKVDGKEQKVLGKPVYFKNLQPERMPPEGEPAYILNTEIYQSINPLWVVLLTPVVVGFFSLLRKRGREPSTASKIGWGLFVSALSTLVMVWAVQVCSNGEVKASSWWLMASYGVITIGELMLSPMGLSLVSKVSPARLTALMMGGWFLSTSIGNKLSGVLASLWDNYDDKADFFLVNFGLLMGATLIMFIMLRWLNRIIPEKRKAHMSTTPTLAEIRDFKGKYPKQLWYLFGTEMWERFCFYGMRGMLTVFMVSNLGLDDRAANLQYGAIQAFVYAFTFIGGVFADKILGFQKSLFWGATLMIAGGFIVAFSPEELFYIGISFSIIGTGFFKPNISTMVGQLYHDGDHRRDAGFGLFYAGINLGALMGGALMVWVGKNYSWRLAFALVGIVMIISLINFIWRRASFGPIGLSPLHPDMPKSRRRIYEIATYIGSLLVIPLILIMVTKTEYTDLFMYIIGPVTLVYLGWEMRRFNAQENKRLLAALVFILFSILFWAFFEQSGGSLSLFALNNLTADFFGLAIDPNVINNSSNSLFVIAFSAPLGLLWFWLSARKMEPNSVVKFGLGFLFLALAFYVFYATIFFADADGITSLEVFTLAYFIITIGELCLSPIGLSLMTKLSPLKIQGLMMGMWFLASAYGQYVAGLLGAGMSTADPNATAMTKLQSYTDGYMQLAIYALIAGVVLIAISPLVRKLMRGVH